MFALQVFLVFGKSGWIGGLVGDILKAQGAKYEYASARLEDRNGVLADVERVNSLSRFLLLTHRTDVLYELLAY